MGFLYGFAEYTNEPMNSFNCFHADSPKVLQKINTTKSSRCRNGEISINTTSTPWTSWQTLWQIYMQSSLSDRSSFVSDFYCLAIVQALDLSHHKTPEATPGTSNKTNSMHLESNTYVERTGDPLLSVHKSISYFEILYQLVLRSLSDKHRPIIIILPKLSYFTKLDLSEIRGFPFLSYLLDPFRVRSCEVAMIFPLHSRLSRESQPFVFRNLAGIPLLGIPLLSLADSNIES